MFYLYKTVLCPKMLIRKNQVLELIKFRHLNIIILLYVVQMCSSSVSWGCRICQLHLCRGVRPLTQASNKCLPYDSKPFDGEALVVELWGIRSTLSLRLLPGPLEPRVVILIQVSSICQIELFNHLLYWKRFSYVQTND